MNKSFIALLLTNLICLLSHLSVNGQTSSAMINIYGRRSQLLNGDWRVIIDPIGVGEWRQVWKERQPKNKTEFVEYSFKDGPILHVPGDFNTQMPALAYLEATVWYQRNFTYQKKSGKRLFLHFGAVNYLSEVYLNGERLGMHEGGFTPFQFELTPLVKDGENSLVVKVNNQRSEKGIPALGYDWFNYGGITRDVHLVETPLSYIDDYFIQLQKNSLTQVQGWVHIDGSSTRQNIHVRIPELKLDTYSTTDEQGKASINFSAHFQLWSPEHPRRYQVILETPEDTLTDSIGFRSIAVQGTKILLNNRPLFLKGVNIHEERPFHGGRAYSAADALTLLS
jgi:beta-glucuronidase